MSEALSFRRNGALYSHAGAHNRAHLVPIECQLSGLAIYCC
jgi:hypothetical protein